jgi:Ca-activated chloride channel family protein
MKRIAFALLLAWSAAAQALDWPQDFRGWWLTPDQQGQRLFDSGRYLDAAERFEDPGRRGAAYYRGGDFERAAGVYGRMRSPEAAYNRGNALIMLGQYDAAIESYERALELRPDWSQAEDNLALALARKRKLAPPESDAGGTGGMLVADEVVLDDSGRVDRSGTETVTEGGEPMSEEEMRAIWLRRVQNDPADFLRARFAWQLQRREREEMDAP